MYREPETVSTVRDAVERFESWRMKAACKDASDPDIYFSEGGSRNKDALGSSRVMEAYALCAICPVRRECVEDSLKVWDSPIRDNGVPSRILASGVWGAADQDDRAKVRNLPISEAVEVLEAGLPKRLSRRVWHFRRRHPARPHRRCANGRCTAARKLLDQISART